VADRLDFDTFTLIYLSNDEVAFEVELTVNKGRTEPYALGDGYGHLAVSVNDLDGEHDRLGALGLNPKNIVEFKDNGVLLARFFFIEDPDGYKIEVVQRHGRFKLGKCSQAEPATAPIAPIASQGGKYGHDLRWKAEVFGRKRAFAPRLAETRRRWRAAGDFRQRRHQPRACLGA
jgi:lactoylglutathione lyase